MSQPSALSSAQIEGYLDEALPAEEMARIEALLRQQPELLELLAQTNARRDAGLHSLGEIWRRHRLSCPSRDQLGGYLLLTLPADFRRYVEFHLSVAGCRYCQANLADLQSQQAEAAEAQQNRRRRYFQSSAGLLPRGRGEDRG